MAEANGIEGETFSVFINASGDRRINVPAQPDMTVENLREISSLELGYALEDTCLFHSGVMLYDNHRLREYGVENNNDLYLLDVRVPFEDQIQRFQMRPIYMDLLMNIMNIPGVEEFHKHSSIVSHFIMLNPVMHDVIDGNRKLEYIFEEELEIVEQMIEVARQTGIRRGMAGRELGDITPNRNPLPNPWAYAMRRRVRGNPVGDLAASTHRLIRRLYPHHVVGVMPEIAIAPETDALITAVINKIIADHGYLNEMLGFTPELQEVLDSRPWLKDAMQSPGFVNLVANREIVHELIIHYRDLVSHADQEEGRTSGQRGFITAAWRLEKLMNLFADVLVDRGIAFPQF